MAQSAKRPENTAYDARRGRRRKGARSRLCGERDMSAGEMWNTEVVRRKGRFSRPKSTTRLSANYDGDVAVPRNMTWCSVWLFGGNDERTSLLLTGSSPLTRASIERIHILIFFHLNKFIDHVVVDICLFPRIPIGVYEYVFYLLLQKRSQENCPP